MHIFRKHDASGSHSWSKCINRIGVLAGGMFEFVRNETRFVLAPVSVGFDLDFEHEFGRNRINFVEQIFVGENLKLANLKTFILL